MSKPIVMFHTEEFSFEKKGEGKDATVIISGNAQPLNEDSRNGVRYRPDSIKKAAKSLMDVAFLFNHNAERSLGHVVKQGLTDSHLTYSADVDPEEKEYIRKVERGDIKHVSVGCLVSNVQFNEEDNIYECDVDEYVELSAVTVPGFSNTSANKEGALYLAAALGDEKVAEKLKAAAEKNKEDVEPAEEDDGVEESIEAKDDDDSEDDEEACDDDDKEKESDDSDDDDKEDEAGDNDDDDEEDEATDGDDEEEANDDDEKDESKEESDGDEDSEEAGEGDAAETPKEESVDGNSEEQGDEATTEEKVATLENKTLELQGKLDEFENRLAIAESKIDMLNDEEGSESVEDTEADEPEDKVEELNPAEEEFKSEKQMHPPTKESIENKEKALTGKTESSNKVNMSKVRRKNLPY